MIILGKYALDKGVELGKEVGPKALDTAKDIFTIALDHLRQNPKTEVIVEEFEQDPESAQQLLQKKLAETLQSDPDFAASLKTMLEQYEQAAKEHAVATGTTYQALVSNSTAAIGAGAAAASKGSAAVSGNVEGGIHISYSDKDDQ
jgi:predicted DsbA family dithiol-disulfide isomerase